jgi:hypothetical protein
MLHLAEEAVMRGRSQRHRDPQPGSTSAAFSAVASWSARTTQLSFSE